jgi:hypothetical protein
LRTDEQEGEDEKYGRSTSMKSQGQAARLTEEQEGSRTPRKFRGWGRMARKRQTDARNEQEDSRTSRKTRRQAGRPIMTRKIQDLEGKLKDELEVVKTRTSRKT